MTIEECENYLWRYHNPEGELLLQKFSPLENSWIMVARINKAYIGPIIRGRFIPENYYNHYHLRIVHVLSNTIFELNYGDRLSMSGPLSRSLLIKSKIDWKREGF
jgi:hypothetical protein